MYIYIHIYIYIYIYVYVYVSPQEHRCPFRKQGLVAVVLQRKQANTSPLPPIQVSGQPTTALTTNSID